MKKALSLFLSLLISLLILSCDTNSEDSFGKAPAWQSWPSPIEMRTYPGAFSREPEKRLLKMSGLAGEVVSAQVVVKGTSDIKGLRGNTSKLSGFTRGLIGVSHIRVRYGKYLPVDETMTLTADPLMEYERVDVPANTAQPVWLTVEIPDDAPPNKYVGVLVLSDDTGAEAKFDIEIEVIPAVLPPPGQWSFYLNIWQDPSGVARAHKVKLWSEEHWALLENYAKNFAAHGMKSIMTSVVYDPWGSQSGYPFESMVEWEYPGEWGLGGADKFEWDFAVFDRYVTLMMDAGVDRKIDCYAIVRGPGSTRDAHIRYLDTASGEYRLQELSIGEPMWREAWNAFLPAFRKHLKEKGWFEKAVLGFDEKPEDDMKIVFDYIKKEAKDFKVALSGGFPGDEEKQGDEICVYIDHMLDKQEWKELKPLVDEMHADPNRFVTFYTACAPYYPNTFLYSRLRESRMLPWLAWKWGFDGYTRWAVNAFPEDVWNQPNYKWHSGDMYFVYPGENGPLDGMRWELMRQGIQDYEAFRIAWNGAEKAGRKDLLKRLEEALAEATRFDSCHSLPFVSEGRDIVNEVLHELNKNN